MQLSTYSCMVEWQKQKAYPKLKRTDGSTLDDSTEDDSGEENEFMLEDWDQWLTDTPTDPNQHLQINQSILLLV